MSQNNLSLPALTLSYCILIRASVADTEAALDDICMIEDGASLPPIDGVNDGWRNIFCDYEDPERNLGFLCPKQDGFVPLVETHFSQLVTMVLDDEDKRR